METNGKGLRPTTDLQRLTRSRSTNQTKDKANLFEFLITTNDALFVFSNKKDAFLAIQLKTLNVMFTCIGRGNIKQMAAPVISVLFTCATRNLFSLLDSN